MRLGAKEFFGEELQPEEIRSCVERFVFDYAIEVEDTKEAPILAVTGAKGGLGATTVSCQLASALQRFGRVAIVDLDVGSGDVGLYFDIKPPYTLADLGNGNGLDSTYVRTLLDAHRCGVRILAAPDRIEHIESVGISQLERAIELLRRDFDWIVLDVPGRWDEISLKAFDMADKVLLVTGFEVPALHHARRHLEIFERLGHKQKVSLVANRKVNGVGVDVADATDFLKREPDFILPNDFQSAAASIDRGLPLADVAPRSKLTKSFDGLSRQVYEWAGIPIPETKGGGGKLRNWIQGKKGERNGVA
jgi:pilus assembly protein CpaE